MLEKSIQPALDGQGTNKTSLRTVAQSINGVCRRPRYQYHLSHKASPSISLSPGREMCYGYQIMVFTFETEALILRQTF